MKPETEAALADAIKSAKGPLAIEGGGTRGLQMLGDRLSIARLSGITLYEPGALTIVAQAGTPVDEIDAALAKEGQRLAFEPMDYRALLGTKGVPTLGGVIAANISGPRRIQGGAARDYALGVRFVDGQGSIVKNGGRVMKNVTGYDLVKLMCGAHGTLGVLTEVSLKVLPKPETQATLVLHNLDDDEGVRAMSQALGSPFEVSGAAHGTELHGSEAATLLRIEGFEASVSYRIAQLQTLLKGYTSEIEVADDAASTTLWTKIRDVQTFASPLGDVWRVSCKPSDAPGLVRLAQASGAFFDWGGGRIWLRIPEGSDLRPRLGAFDGHATLVRAGAETRAKYPVFQPEPAGVARLTAGLRARFDPRGILNAGLMGPAEKKVA
jgi:glycolate oxidase FAD binding subunit